MSRHKAPEEYLQECKEKGLDLPIEDYVNANVKIKHKCKQGHVYLQRPHNHLLGEGCRICRGSYKYTPKEYIQLCKRKKLDLPVEDYKGKNIKILFKCNRCGELYKQRPDAHINQKQGHRKCYFESKKISIKDYKKIFKEKGLDLPIKDVTNNNRRVMEYKCNNCGNTYTNRVDLHLRGVSCPICNESHGEKYIRNYLDKHNIKYTPQKRFQNLKDKTYLSYDFYLPNQKVLIEYQGRQHYEENDFFGGKERFKQQQLHDNLKREYAKNNGYKLLELKYTLDTQDKVDKYLSRRIKY